MISIQVFLVFFVACCVSVESLPFTIDILENRDIIFPKRSDLVKRTANNDVSELNQQKISLASFIENIETGILQTALSVDPLARDSHHAEVRNISTPHPVEKRSTKEEINTAAVESSTPLILVQSTEIVPAIDSVPSHVVIDRVSVFKVPEVGSGLFPTFFIQDTNVSSEMNSEAGDNEEESTPSNNADSSVSEDSAESNESTGSSKMSDENSTKVQKITLTIENESSTTTSPSSSSSSSSSSTTPLSVEEKNNVEKELKEKIGEIEAEPVIFTARV